MKITKAPKQQQLASIGTASQTELAQVPQAL